MHNHVNTKGIIVSNELQLIEDAAHNSLLEFFSGLPYSVGNVLVVRKVGSDLEVVADPYGWLVAATPLDDHLDRLAARCALYEAFRAAGVPHYEAACRCIGA